MKKTETSSDIDGDQSGRVRTITDLARLAGVNPATVSRALAGKNVVSQKTRERIQSLAREHGFRPNQTASNLRRQRTGVIGVAIPLGHDRQQQLSDPFFMILLGHLADQLTAHGYDLMLRRVVPERNEDWLDEFISSGMIDGLIIIGQSDQFARLEHIADGFLPMVVWGNHQEGQRHCVVGTDNRLGGQLAAEQLIAAGARKIAFVGDTGPIEFGARYAGAKHVIDKMNASLTVWPTHLSPGKMGQEIAQYLDNCDEIDGIFAATDSLAFACLQELKLRKKDVPNSVKLVGFDDLPFAQQTTPPLTTVHQDIAVGAKALVNLLLRRLGGEATESLILPPRLIVRQSA
jgi:DNA-binding LacI/PurR family transcriptional regulator